MYIYIFSNLFNVKFEIKNKCNIIVLFIILNDIYTYYVFIYNTINILFTYIDVT
jgi:hypothetical protein